MTDRRPIEVHVRRLVLDPALAGQRDAIVADVERALAMQRGFTEFPASDGPGPVGRAVAHAIDQRVSTTTEDR